MINSYSSLRKQRINHYLLNNFIIALSLALVLISLTYFGLTRPLPTTARVEFVDIQSAAYIEDEFRMSYWYSLVDNIEASDQHITMNTYIFPDQEGRLLAAKIVKELRAKGIQGEISIYGKNMSNRLLVKSTQ